MFCPKGSQSSGPGHFLAVSGSCGHAVSSRRGLLEGQLDVVLSGHWDSGLVSSVQGLPFLPTLTQARLAGLQPVLEEGCLGIEGHGYRSCCYLPKVGSLAPEGSSWSLSITGFPWAPLEPRPPCTASSGFPVWLSGQPSAPLVSWLLT